MSRVCKKMVHDKNTCDSIAAGGQIALFTMHVGDGQQITLVRKLVTASYFSHYVQI